jgi:hypothetical protein
VVYAKSANDVSVVVSFCRDNQVKFVVSGGKHSVGGHSSITGKYSPLHPQDDQELESDPTADAVHEDEDVFARSV